jgi:hypothetical protein
MSHYSAVASQLQERLHKLMDRVGRIEGDLRAPHDRDWPDRATELENDDVLQGLDELSRAEVRRILLALKRNRERALRGLLDVRAAAQRRTSGCRSDGLHVCELRPAVRCCYGTSTAAPVNRPSRKSDSAWFASVNA